MEFSIGQIATMLNGEVEQANTGEISFLSNPKYENFIYNTQATAVIVAHDFEPKEALKTNLIKVSDPYSAFTLLLEEYDRIMSFSKTGIEEFSIAKQSSTIGRDVYRASFSYIGENCTIGNNVKIYPHVYIGDNCKIGDNTILYSGSKLYANSIVGNYCVLHAGAIIGSDGFGFAPQPDGSYKTIPQLGQVILGNYVSIGANTVVDRATMGATIIKDGVKLDNLVQIAHNVEIGEHTVMAAQVGIAGSTKIGKYCVFGGQVGIGGHINVADKTQLGAKSGIIKEIKKEGQAMLGAPAMPVKDFFKVYAIYKNLPEMLARIAELEEKTVNLPTNKEKAV
jgi:UDP-3-O-[3-hydroxymyristoyl] glucosamine N-acyltransferase